MIITARVDKYLPDNVSSDYEDGSFEWFDTTILTILEPNEFRNKKLHIDHDYSREEDSIWRKIGNILTFDLNPRDILSANTQIFSGGIKLVEKSADFKEEKK